jgi:UDP-N-acetylmuramoyl-tripeptide--D-alanyl-D-alanine ligase
MAESVNIRTLEWVAATLAGVDGALFVANGIRNRGRDEWSGAVVDSRAECSGRLFFALRGEHTDGHRFVRAAYESGSAAAIVEDGSICDELGRDGIPYVLVSNCLRSLQELARAYRRHLDVRVIAITGSSGKTTTKEYIRRILKTKFRVFANPGNFNSLIGVPLTILETERDNEYLVCEVGANQAGEVGFLSGLLRPEIGVITNVGDAHVGMFGSVENIARAKAEMLEHVASHGSVLLPKDDAFFDFFEETAKVRSVTFGQSNDVDFLLTDVESTESGIAFKVNDERITLNAVGTYNALNACAAFAAGDVCGVEHDSIRTALAEVKPMPGRGRIHAIRGITLIDESYNASPASMRVSLAMLEELSATRKLAVLGDMKELGEYREERHRGLGQLLAATNVNAVFWLGEDGGEVKAGFEKAGGSAPLRLYDSLDRLVEDVCREARAGDAILVKASRACNLDRFVTRLLDDKDSNTVN